VIFAFAFYTFVPEGRWMLGRGRWGGLADDAGWGDEGAGMGWGGGIV
jgi:hypothetical protein